MKLAEITKGREGRCRITFKLFGKYIVFSNAPLRFRSLRDCMLMDQKFNKVKSKILMTRGNSCQMCGIPYSGESLQMHHVKPVTKFPELRYDPQNILVVCKECHKQIHSNEKNEE